MRIVDLNVLLYALNEDAAHHVAVSQWWNEAINGDEAIGLPWMAAAGVSGRAKAPRRVASRKKPARS